MEQFVMSNVYPIGCKCPFGRYTYKQHGKKTNICDGLCNNCGLNCKPDKCTWPVNIVTRERVTFSDNDYEGKILQYQEWDVD